MSQNNTNSIISTASAVFGGVGKALFSHQTLANITLTGVADVAFYAAVSAITGIGIKLIIDVLKNRFKR